MSAIDIRQAGQGDLEQILSLAAASLGWLPDGLHRSFFEWKHQQNPFGASPMWVAVDGDRVVGFRTFLRWEFARGTEIVRAVRAVDTATHPDYQGRGIFRRLTLHALDELQDEGVAFVFNTPNDQSRPGYLKMGWAELGRLGISFRPRSLVALPRVARARVPADMWSVPCEAGLPATQILDVPWPAAHDAALSTNRTIEYLRWRYGFAPLAYRAVTSAAGTAVFRVRRRGRALEAAIVDLTGSDGAAHRAAALAGADYAVRVGRGSGFVPLPNQGPIVTWRALNETATPSLHDFDFSLGDVELF